MDLAFQTSLSNMVQYLPPDNVQVQPVLDQLQSNQKSQLCHQVMG